MRRHQFYKGQRLVTPYYYYEDWPKCEQYVIVTKINKEFDIVHYKLNVNDVIGGVLHSGMNFKEAKEWFPKN